MERLLNVERGISSLSDDLLSTLKFGKYNAIGLSFIMPSKGDTNMSHVYQAFIWNKSIKSYVLAELALLIDVFSLELDTSFKSLMMSQGESSFTYFHSCCSW